MTTTSEARGSLVDASPAARAQRGKEARARSPRSGLGVWDPPADRRDPVDVLMEQGRDRVADLLPIRYGRMVQTPFAFLRGSAAVMAADLATTASTGLRVQLCGDAHVSNFGGFASPDRRLVFDLNDFDETLPGPWEWDVKRLVASLAVAGRDRGMSVAERRRVVISAARAYREAMREFSGMSTLQVWYSRMTADDVVRRWGQDAGRTAVQGFQRRVERAESKDSARAVARLTTEVDGSVRFVSEPPLLVPVEELFSSEQLQAIQHGLQQSFRAYRRSLADDRRRLLDRFSSVHVARKVVGVGSVGTRAWILLLQGKDASDPLVLQIKEAKESVLAPYAGRSAYRNMGQRVVEGQRLMQAASDILLGWTTGPLIDDRRRDLYVRQLWDWKLSGDLDRADPALLSVAARVCGWTLARAHARSGDAIAIGAYLGNSSVFEDATTVFAEAYADQTERDHARLREAVRAGVVPAVSGV